MATTHKNWFEVDRQGFRQLLAARGKEFVVFELIPNAWDERITRVDVTLSRPVHGRSELVVTDDSSSSFVDLSHAFTMYAPSAKKAAPQLRDGSTKGKKRRWPFAKKPASPLLKDRCSSERKAGGEPGPLVR